MKLEIRRVGPSDAAVFDRIAPEVFDEAIVPERLAAYLSEPWHLMVLALVEGEVVGQAAGVLHRHPDKPMELYVDEVGVTPALTRRGIAKAMMAELEAWGRELGCEECWVGTELDNVAARALYESRGGEAGTFVMYEYDL